MTSTLRPVLALCLAICFSYSSAQEVTSTGNLIDNSNWSGATYGVDPGGCCASISGSGALYDTSTNTIMFSYGTDTLTQTIGLQQALGGTGIQVHGYSVSFDYRLVGTSNGMVTSDELYVLTRITDSAGTSTQLDYWNLSGGVISGLNDFWATVGTTRSFSTPYLDPQSITFEMNGRDGGYWAGYYGPEVRNVSLSVNYSFDPCVSDPLYSTSCAGYWEAFQQLTGLNFGAPAEDTTTIDYALAPTTASVTATSLEDSTRSEPVVDAGGVEVSATGELAVPDGIPEVVKPEPVAATESEDKESKPGPDLSQILSIVREATDNTAALAVVNQSIAQSVSAAANPADGIGLDGTGAENIAAGLLPHLALDANSTEASSDLSAGITVATAPVIEPVQETLIVTVQSLPRLDAHHSEPGSQDTAVEAVAETATEITLELPAPVLATDAPQTTTDSESRRDTAPPSELAGGVDAAELTRTPQDFTAYLDRSLQDARFYQEREIYPGQQTVDNRRAERLLSEASDRLHQSIVDQQYRRQ